MELNSAADGIFLVPELEGLAGLPEIRTTSGVNAGYDGGWTSAQNYDARLIAIRGVIADKDIAKVEATRRKLASLLGQGRKEQLTLRFTTEAGNAYTISVRTISCEMALQRVLNKQDFLIQLRADDPLIYDDGASGGTEAILRVQQALGGFEINFGLPLAIGGSSDATAVENGAETVYPIIKLYGPLHSPTVVNMTTNQQMQIIADLGYTITWSGWTGVSGERLSIPNELDKEAPLRFWSVDGNIEQDGTPTPSAPVPVQTVTGRQTVTVAGKNLFDPTQATGTVNGVTFTKNADGTYTANGTATGFVGFTIGSIKLPTSTTVTYSGSPSGGSGSTYSLNLQKVNGSVWLTDETGNGRTATLEANEAYYVRLIIRQGYTANNLTYKPMVELGNSASSYEPYNGQNYEINLGKNLFDKGNTHILQAGITTAKIESATANRTLWVPCEPSTTYTVQKRNDGNTNRFNVATTAITPAIDVAITNRVENPNASSITYTTSANAKYLCVQYFRTAETALTEQQVLDSIQIEKGSTASSYSPYFEPIELCKIGTYQDRIYKENGEWWLEKQTGKVILDGSEDWHKSSNTQVDRYWYNIYAGDVVPAFHQIYSDKFFYEYNVPTVNAMWVDVYQTLERLFVNYAPYGTTTVTDLKTWLASNNVTVYYPLATPTTTEITNEEVLEGLEALGDATLYIGANNIYTGTPSALPTLEVDYPTDYDEEHDTIVIDSQARTITLNGADIYHLKTEESEFPVLAPGENRMYLTSVTTSDTGYAEVKFKQGYLSI